MSDTYLKNIFDFKRPLPQPFNGMNGKKINVSSMYGDKTAATLCCSVIKAIHSVCDCMRGAKEGAVGIIDHRSVAEYKSAESAEKFHLVVYNRDNGSVNASVYDRDTELCENYVLNGSGRDGAAVFMAMFPVLLSDKEFEENFNEYYEEMRVGYPDMKKATEVMAILCDNVYRRLNDETCVAHVKTVIDKSGNLMRVSSSHLDSGTFEPTRVLAGEFTIFAKTGPAVIKKGATAIDHVTFVKQYSLGTRKLSQLEEGLVPELPPWYVIPSEVVDICKHAQATTGKSMPMRNFLLRGPAGTGKTMGAKAIAAGLGLPYMKYTCSANTEVFDFIGMIFPDSEETSTGDAQLDAEKQALLGMGGITYENIAKLMQLPDLADMDYDPAGVYMTLTGVENLNATSQDCMAIVLDRVTEKIKDVSKSVEKKEGQGQTYRYLETDFIKALKYGYVIEIQEPTTIMQPGVLVGLNSLLEQTGTITLPTGEVIKRHPDAVVVITTNVDYEGCRGMNQSVIDRMSLVRDVELPTPEVMVERAMSVTGVTNEYEVAKMVQVVNSLAEYCRKNSISDGSYGMRSLIDWIISSEITGDIYESAIHTIISKATADEQDREALISAVLEPIFAKGHSSWAA